IALPSADEKCLNLRHFSLSDSGNSPDILPAGLPATLPYGLPEPAERVNPLSLAGKIAGRKPGLATMRNRARLGELGRGSRSIRRPRTESARPGAFLREPRAIPAPLQGDFGPLGIPLNITEVARLIGCSPWSVRQTLIPQGLPHF